MSVPALTVRQPFAWAIASGHKQIENRAQRCHYRGWIWLHSAGELAPRQDVAWCRAACAGLQLPPLEELPRGAIIGAARIVGCEAMPGLWLESDPHARGPWLWILADAQPLPRPIPCPGALGLWQLAPELAQLAAAQLPENHPLTA